MIRLHPKSSWIKREVFHEVESNWYGTKLWADLFVANQPGFCCPPEMASMSMSPPPGSPPGLSLPKRGRGSRGGRVSTRGAGSRGGRGRAGGAAAAGRKKRESTIASESAANTPAGNSGATPGGLSSIQSPAQREGSIASNSRRSVTTKQGGAGQTVAGDGDEMDEDDDDGDDELALLLGDDEYDEQAKERSEAKEALR